MKIIHIAPLNLKKSAGLTYSIPNFVFSQNQIKDVTSQILVSIKPEIRNESFFYIDDFENEDEIKIFLSKYDIAIFHSTYIIKHVKLSKILRDYNIPYVIVPRGGFTKTSKNVKKIKKRIGDLFIFNKFFNSSFAIHYLTYNEKINSVYKTVNDFILPNGITLPNKNIINSDIHDEKHEYTRLIYIGRLNVYIKGLDVLIEAVSHSKIELIEKKVIIELYGPDKDDSVKELKKLIEQYDVKNIVKVCPPVYEFEKENVLRNADYFIQTSRFEGLPMGVLEALSYGVPCILTPGTNISSEVEKHNAGIEVSLEASSISQGILKVLNTPSKRSEMQKNATKLANKYSWDSIASESIEIYKKMIWKGNYNEVIRKN